MFKTLLVRYSSLLITKESLQPSFFSQQTKLVLSSLCFNSLNMYNVVFVLGGPGAGKGTQCVKIVEKYGYVHLSAGDLLRAERSNTESEYGQLISEHIKRGSIVPVAITCALLRKAMEKSGKNHFLIDGFPRNKDNLDGWNQEMNDVADVKMVLVFNCSENVCVNRCLERGKTSGRTDDNAESLKKRIVTFNESTKPIIEHYQVLNLVQEIPAEKSPNEVFEDVQQVFNKLDS